MYVAEYRPKTFTGRNNRGPQQWVSEGLGAQIATKNWHFYTESHYNFETNASRDLLDKQVYWTLKAVSVNRTIVRLAFDDQGEKTRLVSGLVSLGLLMRSGIPHPAVRTSINAVFDQLEYQGLLTPKTRVHRDDSDEEGMSTCVSNTYTQAHKRFELVPSRCDDLSVIFGVKDGCIDFDWVYG